MSKTRSLKSARNPPKQSRSRATVSAILDAAVQVLDREGEPALSTTRIAEVAGVSIGTLYQYFANRDAVLDALQDREFERAMALMQDVLVIGAPASSRELARNVIQGLLNLYASAPGLHRVLAVEGLRITPTARVQAFDLRVVAVIRGFLQSAPFEIRRANVDAAAFVIYHAVRAAMLGRLIEAPPGLDDETLIAELTDLVLRYLVVESLPKGE